MNQKSYTENCVPDEDIMKYKPVRMTFFHYDRSTSKRKLLWHDGDAKTGVNWKCWAYYNGYYSIEINLNININGSNENYHASGNHSIPNFK